jgi:hypothetical protein
MQEERYVFPLLFAGSAAFLRHSPPLQSDGASRLTIFVQKRSAREKKKKKARSATTTHSLCELQHTLYQELVLTDLLILHSGQ